MNKEIFEKLDRIDDLIFNIDVKAKAINEKLDELIKALHAYDDDQLYCEYSGLPSVMAYDEEAANKRMDIIGQNGNTGEHYTSNYDDYSSFKRNEHKDEFDDYGKRVGKDKDNNNNPAKHTGGKKKSAYDKHMKYPPHKH
jgi:hypothetical protein